jgi:hypothetical protein
LGYNNKGPALFPDRTKRSLKEKKNIIMLKANSTTETQKNTQMNPSMIVQGCGVCHEK